MSHPDEIFSSQESGLPVYYQTDDSTYDYQYYPVQDSFSLVPYPASTSYLQDTPIAPVFNNNDNTTFSTATEYSDNNRSSASSQGTPQGTPEVLTSSYEPRSTVPIPEPVNPGPSAVEIPFNQISHDVQLKFNINAASSLERHLLLISSRPKLYRCMSCSPSSEVLRGTQAAKSHVYQHLFGTSKPYVCRTCNVEFASERAAERHKRNQEKKYPCQFCGRPFARKDAMRAHEKKGKCGRSLAGFPTEVHQ